MSQGQIHLEALADLSDKTTVNVNLLTHLKTERVKKLLDAGMSFKEANTQAQKELLTNFGLQQYTTTDATDFSITSGTKEAGALIVFSSALLYKRSEAELTEYLSKLNQEFTEQGKLTDEMKKEYLDNCTKLDFDRIEEHITERYRASNKEVSVPPLQYFVDWDGDGIAGNELGDSGEIRLAFEKDTLFVPAEGGTFRVKVNSNIPFTFTPAGSIPHDQIVEDNFFMRTFNISGIDYTHSIENDDAVLAVAPAEGYFTTPSTLTVYSYDGSNRADLVIVQKGDKNKSFLKSDGKAALDGMVLVIANTILRFHTMEALYTNTYAGTNGAGPFETHTLDAGNNEIYQAWSQVYQVLRNIRVFAKSTNDLIGDEFSANFTFLTASLYYEMAVLWENIIYAENIFDINDIDKGKPMKSDELFEMFETRLAGEIGRFENKKNSFDETDDYFLYSKDFPRMVLAKMYLYQHKYAEAKNLLQAVVADGHYRLAPSRNEAIQKNSTEMIWGYLNPATTNPAEFQNMPVRLDDFLAYATYTEVLLSLAECEYRLGNSDAATRYLQQVTSKRNLTVTGDFLTSLKEAWKSELKGTGTYFAFLKRNDLATHELQIEEFRLIFPIPQNEVQLNPVQVQNPGYW
ncbi:MAG: RagB/SusD family nutrient uptake outer membrane protein [Parabacteroides sp.]|nr:RagB/SusD family nutrient uptake outer membrane protein [Parabacteroides sp.]